MALVETRLEAHIGTLVMNHPAHRNALGSALIEELLQGLRQLVARKARVIVLRAQAGTGTWSAGHDLSELGHQDPLAPDQPLPRLLWEVEHCPVPIVAMIDGGAFGGAVELALVCDLRIGSERAAFTMPPARLALPYSAEGLARFLRVLGLATTQELFYTARTLNAERSLHLGLLNHLVPSTDLEAFTLSLAGDIARNSPRCLRALKESLRLLAGATPVPSRIEALRQQVLESPDFQEGLQARRARRDPDFSDL